MIWSTDPYPTKHWEVRNDKIAQDGSQRYCVANGFGDAVKSRREAI